MWFIFKAVGSGFFFVPSGLPATAREMSQKKIPDGIIQNQEQAFSEKLQRDFDKCGWTDGCARFCWQHFRW
jgi:hypothetical protein